MNNVRVQKITGVPADPHIESGVVQFGDDWPGVYLRGDRSCMLAYTFASMVGDGLDAGRTSMRDFAFHAFIISHAEALAACDESGQISDMVHKVHERLYAAAVLADTPAAGGVQ